jgi:tetratricopeptide (TPR) repeat protein
MGPDNVPVRAWYTWALVAAERVEEAVEQAYRIMELDPESSYANVLAGDALLMAGHVEEALKLHKKAEELAPDSVLSAWNYGLSLAEASRWKDAIPRFRKAAELSSGGSYFLGILAWSLAAAGQRAEAQKILSELERRAATEYVSPLLRVLASSELDRPEETRKLLSEALNERSGFLVVYRLPIYRKLRNDPLMQELARRLLVQ